jgi:UDP-glucose 4-epimerase
LLRSARLADFSPEQIGFLTFGRGIDTTLMRSELGFEPDFTTAEAFADFGRSLGHHHHVADEVLARIADVLPEPRPALRSAPKGVRGG